MQVNLRNETKFYEEVLVKLVAEASAANASDDLRRFLQRGIEDDLGIISTLGIPLDPTVRGALVVLLREESAIPITALLAQRLLIYIALIPALSRHRMASKEVQGMGSTISHLHSLAKHYAPPHAHRTIDVVDRAIVDHSLAWFRDSDSDPDVWVVLKTLSEDQRDKVGRERLMRFVLRQLRTEWKSPNTIMHRRHIWWALETVVRECERTATLRKLVNNLTHRLLDKGADSASSPGDSIVPELHEEGRESAWEAINICKMLRSSSWFDQALITRLEDRVEATIARDLSTTSTRQSLYAISLRLLLAYETSEWLDASETSRLMSLSELALQTNQVGQLYFETDVAKETKAMLKKADQLLVKSDHWDPVQAAALISGGPAQGKSELMSQISMELENRIRAAGGQFKTHNLTVGKNLDSVEALERLKQQLKSTEVHIVTIDEFEKNDFGLELSLLPILQPVGDNPPMPARSFWLFVQSSFLSREQLEREADRRDDKSLRDLLTRLQWGNLDVKDLRDSAEQRLLTAIGLLRRRMGPMQAISRRWATQLLSRRVRNARELKRLVDDSDLIIDDGVVRLSVESGDSPVLPLRELGRSPRS